MMRCDLMWCMYVCTSMYSWRMRLLPRRSVNLGSWTNGQASLAGSFVSIALSLCLPWLFPVLMGIIAVFMLCLWYFVFISRYRGFYMHLSDLCCVYSVVMEPRIIQKVIFFFWKKKIIFTQKKKIFFFQKKKTSCSSRRKKIIFFRKKMISFGRRRCSSAGRRRSSSSGRRSSYTHGHS